MWRILANVLKFVTKLDNTRGLSASLFACLEWQPELSIQGSLLAHQKKASF